MFEKRPRITRQQIGPLCREHGYPIGDSTVERICTPKENKGPPIDAWWNGRALYAPDQVLAWAESHISDRPENFTRSVARPRKTETAKPAVEPRRKRGRPRKEPQGVSA